MAIVYRSTKGSKLTSNEVDGNFLTLENTKQNNLTFDTTPTVDSTNPVTSGGVYTGLNDIASDVSALAIIVDGKQDELPITINFANRNYNSGSNNTVSNPPNVIHYKVVNGVNITDASDRSVISGAGITAFSGLASLVVTGSNISIGQYGERLVVIGHDITYENTGSGHPASAAGDGVIIGNGCYSNGWKHVVIGYKARCEGTAGMAVGWCSATYGSTAGHQMAIGRGAGSFTENGIVLGSYSNYDLWIGNGDAHIFNNTGNDGQVDTISGNLSDKIATYHGPDAWDKQTTPTQFSVAGGSVRLIGGAATGDAMPGKAYVSVYRKRSSATGFENTKTGTILNNIIVDQDDVTICEAKIWRSSTPGVAYFSHKDFATATDYCISQTTNGTTNLNAASGRTLNLRVGDVVRFSCAASVNTSAVALDIDNVNGLRVQGNKVVGARKTGWTVATGTATRTTFDTATVTTAQLAERLKALIDDLHSTAGHGLITT